MPETALIVPHTLATAVSLEGIGLHSGKPSRIRCEPAPAGTGLIFVRGGRVIRARRDEVSSADRGITLGRSRTVCTVEHLLAAAAGLGVWNLRVDVDGDELPALDGSARPYVDAFLRAGLLEQEGEATAVAPETPVWVREGEGSILALPARALRVTYVVPLPPAVGMQVTDVTVDPESFAERIAPARTWGDPEELSVLQGRGLARGASPENALGVGSAGYTGSPRFPDEPARHKVLDLIGDLALLGHPLRAHVVAVAAGHRLHLRFVQALQTSSISRADHLREGEA